MAVFLDSGFFLSLLHPLDPNHDLFKEKFRTISTGEHGIIFTSAFVVAETATIILLRTHNNLTTLEAFWELIYGNRQFSRIIHSTPDILKKSWDVFHKHNSNATNKRGYLSFVDASNIAICRDRQISHILAVDSDFDGYLTRL